MTSSRRLRILSPAAPGPDHQRPLAERPGSLAGLRVGIRRDRTWGSFEVFTDELARLLRERDGVAEVVFFDPGTRIGTPEDESARVTEFAREVEAAVVGLGT
ncbi:MAG: hypothetical protein ACKOCT_04415 [Alphaproteobacteria bacterium]